MSFELLIVGILVLLPLGVGIGWLWQSRKTLAQSLQVQRLSEELAAAQAQLNEAHSERVRLQAQVQELQINNSAQEARLSQSEQTQSQVRQQYEERLADQMRSQANQSQTLEELRQRHQTLAADYAAQQTRLEEKEQQFKAQLAQLNASREALTKEFENVANKIFEEKGRTFASTSQQSLDTLLKPFKEQLEGFQKRVNDIHESSTRETAHLNAEIKKVMEIGLAMSKEATNLTSALKGDSQQRGAWGEAQLRRTLEMSGLVEDAHYETQTSFKDAEGKTKQTDYLIKLPDGKHIIIDSKVSLNAYDRVVSADTPEAAVLAMDEHIKAVKGHIDDLASKDYTNVLGMRSPSFVLMFMPIEPAYIEALKHKKDLFDYGYRKGIVLVSHTTLIPILRTVSNLWMIERSNAEAREISEKAGDIFNTVSTLAERLAKLGNTLNTAGSHYNDTITALAGKQGLYGKVDRFKTLSTKVTKELPKIEHRHIDIDDQKLQLIIEEVPEVTESSELPEVSKVSADAAAKLEENSDEEAKASPKAEAVSSRNS